MEDYRKIAIELGQTLINKAPETREDVERMLPELKESDDERIRKAICYVLNNSDYKIIENTDYTVSQMESWLEKQGEQKPAWSEEDEKMLKRSIKLFNEFGGDRESSAYTLQEMDCRNCADWLKSIKERVQPQSNQEWSKKDEDKLNRIYEILPKCIDCHPIECKELQDWLKSLRPQSQWKPSEEQMDNK